MNGMENQMTKYARYQDYVIQGGRLVGEFEEMYRDFDDPWHQNDNSSFTSDKALGLYLLSRLRHRHNVKRALELGCGFGNYAARIAETGLQTTGVDISRTAVEKAASRHPQLDFRMGALSDHQIIREINPDVIVMSEVTWYILPQLKDFIDFLKRDLPDTYLFHTLHTYLPGVQNYGADFFTNLAEIKSFFGMTYLESGEIFYQGGIRTWFLGSWRPDAETAWNAAT